ncbi:hypothetical protein EZV62_011453 [Acer yangbiense]|uniref:Uncharacterized protein n=1 Tax=Acer yangbiense TaxID=1000413 RepID=A0A5C7I6M8_9ROSI|nr:hypothetical protein EZV62_011453 [Acer yangbiense]
MGRPRPLRAHICSSGHDYAFSVVGAIPTAGEKDQIPPVVAASDLEVSTGEEGTSSGAAGSCKEVIPIELGNLSNSFNSCFNMKFDIDKFDGSGDFGIWRRKVKALLSQQKILKAIEGPEKLPVSLTEEQKNDMLDMALGTNILSLSDNVLREINDEKTACDVWKKLESLYLTKSLTNKIYLKERLFGFKMDASKGLGENLDDFKKMTIELANAGVDEKLSDENEAIILLNSLHDSFKDVKAAIKYGRTSLSLDECISALKSKDLELKMEKKDSVSHGMKVNVMCRLCSKKAETSVHDLWCCSSMSFIRNGCLVGGDVKDLSQLPFIDFVLFCKGKLDIMYFEFLCVVWWRVWYRRNQLVHEKSPQAVHDFDVLDWATSFIQDFRADKTVDTVSVVKQRGQ